MDGWDPKSEWHLEDLLDDSYNISGCSLSDAERLWIDAWDDFVQLMSERREGRPLPGFPLWADSWLDVENVWDRAASEIPDTSVHPAMDRSLSGLEAVPSAQES